MGKIRHQSLFKKLEWIVEYVEIKDVRLQIMFCEHNFIGLISTQDSGYIYKTFYEVDSSPLEKWIEDFKRDMNPDREIAIWERMAEDYINHCSQRKLSLRAKKQFFLKLLTQSSLSDTIIIKTLNN